MYEDAGGGGTFEKVARVSSYKKAQSFRICSLLVHILSLVLSITLELGIVPFE